MARDPHGLRVLKKRAVTHTHGVQKALCELIGLASILLSIYITGSPALKAAINPVSVGAAN